MTNEQVISRFYDAFQRLDYRVMQDSYSDDAVFSDPVFGLLDVSETRAMWEMLCKRAKGFSLVYDNIKLLDEEYATVDWTASYLFSASGRRVVNKARGYMRIRNGRIIEHSDGFAIYRWTRQALGLPGLLFGWTRWMHKKLQKRARKSLVEFMSSDE